MSAMSSPSTPASAARRNPRASSSSSSSRIPSSSVRSSQNRNNADRLNAVEKRLWQTVMQAQGQTMSAELLQRTCADMDVEQIQGGMNSLLAKSLFEAKHDHNNNLQLMAITKQEASIIGQLDPDEEIIFALIRQAGNEGIWTKLIKTRTGLHQNVINRSLKSMEGRQLIKAVKSVKFKTRKIYMLFSLTPSVELSGGPWYTDNELDTAFIQELCDILHNFVAAKTWPDKGKLSHDPSRRPLYPVSHIDNLPTAATCCAYLARNKITDTTLDEENVQELLDVLVYDGKVEKFPHIRIGRHDDDWTPRGRRDGYESVEEDVSIGDSDGLSDEAGSDAEESVRKRKRGDSAARNQDGAAARNGASKNPRRGSNHRDSALARSIALDSDLSEDDDEEDDEQDPATSSTGRGLASGAMVYRALRQVHQETGWTEVPCAHCPVFDFCAPGGPVNAEGCVYLRDWIKDGLHKQDRQEDEALAVVEAEEEVEGPQQSYDDTMVEASDNDEP